MDAFLRLYSFLSETFDYRNTAVEARSIFCRRLIGQLEFGRERTSVDVSKIVRTHRKLKSQGQQPTSGGDAEALKPLTATGTGRSQQKEKALLAEILAKLDEQFPGDVTDDDQLIHVNNVIKGKLMESETLVQQASQNRKEQFSNSPIPKPALDDAIIDPMEAPALMSKGALGSRIMRAALLEGLLGPGQLHEAPKARGEQAQGTSSRPGGRWRRFLGRTGGRKRQKECQEIRFNPMKSKQ